MAGESLYDALPPAMAADDPATELGRPAALGLDEPDTVIDAGAHWIPAPAMGGEVDDATPIVSTLTNADRTPVAIGGRASLSPERLPSTPADQPAIPETPNDHRGEVSEAPPRPASWASAGKQRREFPRGVRLAAGGLGALLLLVVVGGRCTGAATPTTVTKQYDVGADMAVNHEDLRKRKEMTEEDFRTTATGRVRVREAAPLPVADTPPVPTTPEIPLEERRARRDDNPEDLKQHSRSRRRTPAAGTGPAPQPAARRRSLIRDVGPASPAAGDGQQGSARLVATGSRVKGRLAGVLRIRGNRSSAVVRIGGGQKLPKGTKLIGAASADGDGLVQIRFRTAVLPDGTTLRVSAEAQGRDGATGLYGHVSGGAQDDDDGSMAGDVAEGTSRRVARTALGNGILGGVADDAMRSNDRRSRRRPSRVRSVVSMPKGSVVYVFFLEEVQTDG